MTKQQRIVFFHPDLGIGGAERLIIDAAVGLQSLGHKVTIFTSHRDKAHCFDEARDDTLDVRVRGNLLPATFLGRFKILFTILRHYHLLLQISVSGELKALEPTVFFVDQLSAGLPAMRMIWPKVCILFYCHFPDLLLVQQRNSFVKRIWRVGFDWVEGWSMKYADRIVVNSRFTRGVVEGVWPGLRGVGVIYPCVDTEEVGEEKDGKGLWEGRKVVLSINRFERKKDVGLAIRAFAGLSEKVRKEAKLVIAGGYDLRVQENVSYHEELVKLANSLGLKSATAKNIVTALSIPAEMDVIFLLSVPAQLKAMLLKAARLLVYTPTNEHFGIVPLEAMLAGVPVLAARSGGPLETVVDGKTGWLRDVEKPESWTAVMHEVLVDVSDADVRKMGKAGEERVRAEFSKTKMAKTLNDEIQEMVAGPRKRTVDIYDLLFGAAAVVAIASVIVVALVYGHKLDRDK